MDKKNTIIGVALLLVALFLMFQQGKQAQEDAARQQAEREAAAAEAAESAPAQGAQGEGTSTAQPAPGVAAPATAVPTKGHAKVEANGDKLGETTVSLENELFEVRFTNFGGSIREVVLKDELKTLEGDDPYIMNELRYAPALNLDLDYLGNAKDVEFDIIDTSTPDTLIFRGVINEQIEVTRTYSISQELKGAETFTISHELQIRNITDAILPIPAMLLNIGTVAPSGNQDRFLQTFGYSNGDDVEFTDQSDFMGGGFIFKDDPKDFEQGSDSVVWASVKNQFFITLITPEEPAAGYIARPVDFPETESNGEPKTGITADILLSGANLQAGEVITKNFDFYAGPKEHKRLAKMDKGQDQAMQWIPVVGFISKFLLLILNAVHGVIGNWGVSIILLTLIVRGALLPITLGSMKSMKRMSKLSEPMKALKEKFPDDQKKQQEMMMQLYRLNKVNPVGACLPMVLQIPIFFALFYMLRSAAELRFADFLWISDLSKPDTIATIPNMPWIGDFPVNLLPFVWVVTLAYQMWTMPTPSVDNAQTKMMKFMPFIFFPFTYTFSSGLVLYWTVSNVFTIGQQWLTKRGAEDFEVILPPALKKVLDGDDKKKRRKKK